MTHQTTPSFREDDSSQIPALLLLQAMGFQYLSPVETMRLRGNTADRGGSGNVLLEPILREKLKELNLFKFKGASYHFSPVNITNAIFALQDYPRELGYLQSNRYLFDLLTLGKSFEETIGADKKSFSLTYIDWKHPERNTFHVTEELSVARTGRSDHYQPDIVLYVNGIPLVVIECKRPDMKDPLSQAISQHLRNQQEDGIRPLYVMAQLLVSLCQNKALYATNDTNEEFWQNWRERTSNRQEAERLQARVQALKNASYQPQCRDALLQNPDRRAWQLKKVVADGADWAPTEQDLLLYGLCRPERLLNLIYNFIIFDGMTKIVARHQQFFGVGRTLRRVSVVDEAGMRQGGVIWHTQGSGKSYTMVMLAQLLAADQSILNPKIILVTDRVELDDQIYQTFKRCDKEVVQATTGNRLVEYLEDDSDAILATLINKFDAAIRKLSEPITRPNVFVLIDEAHRTQYGKLSVKMRQVFPTACFIGFTGTALMRREKNTASKFGGIIDTYTVADAVADQAVVPLLFEGRAPLFSVNERPIDNYFNRIAEPLNDYQRSDLNQKFSRRDALTSGEQVIYAKAWDISEHYAKTWKNTGFKGQLVASSKLAAVRFKRFMDEIGQVKTEVLISPPDDREGNEDAYGTVHDEVLLFWKRMMDRFGTAKNYDESLRKAFKTRDTTPEVIIVVNKLLTGFDNPINIVLYLCTKLREHTLFQAITRVNRKAPAKDFGYIIDYDGVIAELAQTLEQYGGTFEDFDTADLEGTVTDMRRELAKLPQRHSDVWDLFKTITNRQDTAAFANLLSDAALRAVFFERLSQFSRLLSMALSNYEYVSSTPEPEVARYQTDFTFFQGLRKSVINMFSLAVDYRQYEPQIQKLIDTHVTADEIVQLSQQVNIFDRESFERELERVEGKAARAHTIASRTDRTITERMDEDPAFYRRLSDLIKETLEAYRQERIDEVEFLKRVTDVKEEVVNRPKHELPVPLQDRPVATAIYGILGETLHSTTPGADLLADWAVQAETVMEQVIIDHGQPLVDWTSRSDTLNQLRFTLDEWAWDVNETLSAQLGNDQLDALVTQLVQIAKARY
ncbi:type I restriction endonuclease subunit R [Fibrella aquatica]|uniref:type I restriction endonuclease subunit R n=1 Tax=Fibrella aquatica TaxID=3242487 RepID=UPI00352159FE